MKTLIASASLLSSVLLIAVSPALARADMNEDACRSRAIQAALALSKANGFKVSEKGGSVADGNIYRISLVGRVLSLGLFDLEVPYQVEVSGSGETCTIERVEELDRIKRSAAKPGSTNDRGADVPILAIAEINGDAKVGQEVRRIWMATDAEGVLFARFQIGYAEYDAEIGKLYDFPVRYGIIRITRSK